MAAVEDQDQQTQNLNAIAIEAKESDIHLMEIIREFTAIYNKRNRDFHDKRSPIVGNEWLNYFKLHLTK